MIQPEQGHTSLLPNTTTMFTAGLAWARILCFATRRKIRSHWTRNVMLMTHPNIFRWPLVICMLESFIYHMIFLSDNCCLMANRVQLGYCVTTITNILVCIFRPNSPLVYISKEFDQRMKNLIYSTHENQT